MGAIGPGIVPGAAGGIVLAGMLAATPPAAARAGPAGFAGAPGATDAALHTRLLASEPADGDTLAAAPSRIRLLFSEPVDADVARVRIVIADGSVVDLEPEADPTDVRALLARLPAVAAGGHRVQWRVVSADGHPIEGDFVFFVRGAGAQEPAAAGPARLEAPPPAPMDTGWRPSPILGALVEALALGTLLGLAGLLLFLPPGERELPRAAAVLALAAPPLLAAHGVLWVLGTFSGTSLTAAVADAAGTTAGRVEIVRLGLAGLAAWALVLARRPRLALVFGFAAVLAGGGVGHALARAPAWSIPAKALHLGAAAVWLGGLLRLATLDPTTDLFPGTARRVSAAALGSVAVIAATGALQAVLLLPAPGDLVATGYGRLVLAKISGLSALIGLGAYHRLRLLPRLDAGSGAPLRRSVRREIVVFAVVLLVAARLAHVPPPEAVMALVPGAR